MAVMKFQGKDTQTGGRNSDGIYLAGQDLYYLIIFLTDQSDGAIEILRSVLETWSLSVPGISGHYDK